jgi:hypothetical protein
VAVVFAREITPRLTSLVKKIDEAAVKNQKMGAFVVMLSDDQDAMEKQLKELAQKEQLKDVALTVFDTAGPKPYKINKDADVTVLLYRNKRVKVNHAYGKGEFQDKDIDAILADLPEITK